MIRDVVGHLRKHVHCDCCDEWIATFGPCGELWQLDATLEYDGAEVRLEDLTTHRCTSCRAKCQECGRIHPVGECPERAALAKAPGLAAALATAIVATACSSSPQVQGEAVMVDLGPIRLCPVELREEYLEASRELWGAVIDCDHPDVWVEVAELGEIEIACEEGTEFCENGSFTSDIGGASFPDLIQVDIGYWDDSTSWMLVQIVIAHELGHILGEGHVCDIGSLERPCTEDLRHDIMYPIDILVCPIVHEGRELSYCPDLVVRGDV